MGRGKDVALGGRRAAGGRKLSCHPADRIVAFKTTVREDPRGGSGGYAERERSLVLGDECYQNSSEHTVLRGGILAGSS